LVVRLTSSFRTDGTICHDVIDVVYVCLQEISNTLAKLSVYACARLGGYLVSDDDTTPDNPAVKKSITAMLTPYLAKKLADNSPHEVMSF